MLSGCDFNRELDEQTLVCSLCFSGGDIFEVSVEVLTENSKEQKLTTRIITATGKTPKEAVSALKNRLSKRLMFDHCAAIVLSPELKAEKQKEILLFCVKNPTINLGTPVIYCRDINALLSLSAETAAVGYDIMLTLKNLSLLKKSRLYEVALDLKGIETFKNDNGVLKRVVSKK